MERERGRRSPVLGVTGNIACGKSTVLSLLQGMGGETVDADIVAQRTMAPDGPAHGPVVATFGKGILTAGGEIDRRALGRIVFAEAEELRRLEALVHPHVRAAIRERMATAAGPLVVDAIKLLEGGLAELCDEIWVVRCHPVQQLKRLMARNGYAEAEARLRIDAQPPQEEKLARASVVIDNTGSIERTQRQVERAWQRFLASASAGHAS